MGLPRHDPRARRLLPRALEVAAARGRGAAAGGAGLVVRGDARPELALTAEEVDLRAIAGRRRRAPDQGLEREPRLLARRDLAAEELPAARAEVVAPALEDGDREGRAERGLERRQVLPDELILERERVRAHDHPLARCGARERRQEVRERLPHTGAGLRDERAALDHDPLDSPGERALLAPLLETLDRPRERAVRREGGRAGRDERPSRWRRERRAPREELRAPGAAHGAAERVAEERRERLAEERGVAAGLLEDGRWERAGAPGEPGEDLRARERVVERAVRGVHDDAGFHRKALERVRRGRREDDRGEIGRVEAPGRARKPGPLEERDVEADVVAQQPGRATAAGEECREGRHRVFGRRCAGEVGLADPGEARDDARQRAAGVHEGLEALADLERPIRREADARRADLDDPLGRRVEPGRLDVDRDECVLHSVAASSSPSSER